MPIYEYRCEACGHEHDELQKISDDPLKDCPACTEPALKRLISAPWFRLKGSGWYETDFKSDKDKRRNLAESGDGGKSDDKAGAGDKPAESGKSDAKTGEAKTGEAKKGDSKSSDAKTSEAKPVRTSPAKSSGNEAA